MRDAGQPCVRIAIADDHQIFRDGLKRLLESEPGFTVIGEAADGEAAIGMVAALTPDILLLDVAMPRLGGIDALEAPELAGTRVVILTAAIEPAELLRAVQLGARGVVLKQSATRELIDGIHKVVAGKLLLAGEIADDLAQAVRTAGSLRDRPFGLTPREVEIVAAVANGESNREIAAHLDISLQTVKHHLTNAFDKTGTSTRLELALFAIRNQIVDAK